MTIFADLPVPAHTLRPGDKIRISGVGTVRVVQAVDHRDRSRVTVNGFDTYGTFDFDPHAMVPLRSPDQPTDGWTTWRDPTGAQGVLGCSCVYRRPDEEGGMWTLVADDPQCRFRHPDEED